MRDLKGRFVEAMCKHGASRELNKGGRCRACCKERSNAYKARHPDKVKAYGRAYSGTAARWRKFGLTEEQYMAMAVEHGGMCAVCQEKEPSGKQLAIDHCHESGKVRGLLCSKCNKGLGDFRDSPELLRRAALYLEASGAHS